MRQSIKHIQQKYYKEKKVDDINKETNLSMIISIPAPLFDVNGRCSKRIFVFENERRTLARTEKN